MGIQRCWHNRKIICLLKCVLFAFISTHASVPLYSGEQALGGQDTAKHRKRREGFGAMSPQIFFFVCVCLWHFTRKRTVAILKDREDVSICLKSARAISGL